MTVLGFSVVIPAYNRSATVCAAVASVLDDAGPPREVIVVDDGSTDDTVAALRSIDDSRLRLLQRQHEGRCAARNAGAAVATADWLVFLDSDDVMMPGALHAFAANARTGTSLLVAPTVRRAVDGQQRRRDVEWDRERAVPTALQAGGFAIERSLFDRLGGYCTVLEFSEHTEMAFRLRSLEPRASIVALDEPTVTVFERPGRYDPAVQYASAVHLLDHAASELTDDRRARAMQLGIAGEAASRLGRPREALALLARSWLALPRWKTAARLARAAVRPLRRVPGVGATA